MRFRAENYFRPKPNIFGKAAQARPRVAAADTPAKSGSCSWDLKIKRCVTLPPHKEPCLVFGDGHAGVTRNPELAKLISEQG